MTAKELYNEYIESNQERICADLAKEIAMQCVADIKSGNSEFSFEIIGQAEKKHGISKPQENEEKESVIKECDIDILVFCLIKEVAFEKEKAAVLADADESYFKKFKNKRAIKKCSQQICAMCPVELKPAEEQKEEKEPEKEITKEPAKEAENEIKVKIAIDEYTIKRDDEFMAGFGKVGENSEKAYNSIETYVNLLGNVGDKLEELNNQVSTLSKTASMIGGGIGQLLGESRDCEISDIKGKLIKTYDLARDVLASKRSKEISAAINILYETYVLINGVYKSLPEQAQQERRNTESYLEKIRSNAKRVYNTEFFESEEGMPFDEHLHECLDNNFDPATAKIKKSELCGIISGETVIKKEIVSF